MSEKSLSEALREKAKKYEALAAFLEDAEMVSAVKGYLSSQEPLPPATAQLPAQPKIQFQLSAEDDPMRTIPGEPSKPRRGELDAAVTEYMKRVTTPMSAREVAEGMRASGYVFLAKDHPIAVAKVLRRLAENQRINVFKDENNGYVTFMPKFPIREIA